MDHPSLYQQHLETIRRSCAALGIKGTDTIPGEPGARILIELASRLPGPPLETYDESDTWSMEDSTSLIFCIRASLEFLSQRKHFSELGERITSGILTTLDSLEANLSFQIRRKVRDQVYGLYVIIDPLITGGRDPLRIAEDSIKGGARILQLRDKKRDKGEGLDLANKIKELCDDSGALLIINDHADVAAVTEAHGVHVGIHDLPVSEVRKTLSNNQIIGRSSHLIAEALQADQEEADYIAVGAMYPTGSKNQPIVGGPALLRVVKASVSPPVVAIGGITTERIPEVVDSGADAICVISAVGLARNPMATTQELVHTIIQAGGRA
ncbi:thiamine phosphate synthase [SAR202 cluster bacterium AD-804-J14_MRT_500m]|nr:thiamine phosphate synthase [SAR202 cluster bacterium AD-804-J14_MRT_500m]